MSEPTALNPPLR